MQKKYYEAYDCRYRQIHEQNLQWFHKEPSKIVAETIEKYSISPRQTILEIGCGEGRDAFALIEQGFDLLATDVSPEAIRYCKELLPDFAERFQVLDCVSEDLAVKFDMIYAIAVVHMLVLDEDRDGFYRFISTHLKPNGIALIGTMGDGVEERKSDIRNAFDLQSRIHEQTGKTVQIASTSCRMVNFQTFLRELTENRLQVLEHGVTEVRPDFSQMMYVVVKRV